MKNPIVTLLTLACSLNVHSALFYFHVDLQGPTDAQGRSLHQLDPFTYPPITLDTDNHTLRIPVAWGSLHIPGDTDLSSQFLTAEIVIEPPGSLNNRLVYFTAPPFVSSKPQGVSGYFDLLLSLDESGSRSGYSVEEQEADLISGTQWQLEIRTQIHQEGEIQGYFVPVPEPRFQASVASILIVAGYLIRRFSQLRSYNIFS